MKEDVRLQRAHEQQRGPARVADAQNAGNGGALKVIADGGQGAAGRTALVPRIERQDDRRPGPLVHVESDVFADRPLQEGDGLLRQAAQNDPRICRRIGRGQLCDEFRRGDAGRAHRLLEEVLLALVMPEQRRGSDLQLDGDVGEGGGSEPLLREDAPRGVQELLAADGRRPSHL